MEEDDDDIYAAEDENFLKTAPLAENDAKSTVAQDGEVAKEDEEEGEEIEEDASDSDIDIITERKAAPEAKAESTQGSRSREAKSQSTIKPAASEPSPTPRDSHAVKIEAPRKETPPSRPGSSYPALKTSTVDVDAKPIYKPSGKALTDMDMDTDFPEDDKPWRKPGTDMTDFFNYGFDEFTWASYCLKQQTLRKEVVDSKKQMEEMQNFLSNGMPTMPGIPGAPAAGAPRGMPSIGGPTDIPPEMQQMFQQMMAQGLDPMSMGPEQMMQMMQGGSMGEPNQGFGGQNFGQQGQGGHQMGYGGGFGGGGGGGGNQGGRGRGRRW